MCTVLLVQVTTESTHYLLKDEVCRETSMEFVISIKRDLLSTLVKQLITISFLMPSKSKFSDYVFMDTNLAPPKNIQGRMTSFPSIIYGSESRVLRFVSRLGVLACRVWPSLSVRCPCLSNSGLCLLIYFICSQTRSLRLWDVNRGNSRIWLHLLI